MLSRLSSYWQWAVTEVSPYLPDANVFSEKIGAYAFNLAKACTQILAAQAAVEAVTGLSSRVEVTSVIKLQHLSMPYPLSPWLGSALSTASYALMSKQYAMLGAGLLLSQQWSISSAESTTDFYPEIKELNAVLSTHNAAIETHDMSHLLAVTDMTESYRMRHLQSTQLQTCESGIILPDKSWALSFDGVADSFYPKNRVVVGSDDSIVMLGQGIAQLTSAAIFLAKFSATGVLIWVKALTGVNPQVIGSSLAIGTDGSMALTSNTYVGANAIDILVAKFTADGSLIWAKSLGGPTDDYGNSLALWPDGSIVLTGSTGSFGAGNGDVLLAQFTSSGSLSWAKTLGGSGSESGKSVALTLDGSIILTGYTSSFGAGAEDVLLAKFTSNGDLSWAKTLGGVDYDRGNSLALRPDGSIVLAGYTASFGTDSLLLAQLSSSGDLSWAKTLYEKGIDANNAGVSLALRPDGNILVTGAARTDLLLAQFTMNGTLIWAKAINTVNGHGGINTGCSLGLLLDGSIVMSGNKGSHGDHVLLKYDENEGFPFLGSDIIFQDLNPKIDSISPSVQSWQATVGNIPAASVSDITGMQSIDIYNDIEIILWNLRAKPINNALDAALNYAYHYELYPNGPFAGIVQTPSISVDLSTASWLKYAFIKQTLYGTPLFVEPGAYTVRFSVSGPGGTDVGSIYGVIELKLCVQHYDYAVPNYFRYSLNPFQTATYNAPYQFNFTELLYPNATVTQVTGRDNQAMPGWLSYDSSAGLLSGLPTGSIRGNYLVDVSFVAGAQSDTVTLVVNVPNTAPQYRGPIYNPLNIGRGVIAFDSRFIDQENDAISFDLGRIGSDSAPAFVNMDPQTGRLTVNSLSGDQGSYLVNITCRDTYQGLGWAMLNITLQNRAPERTQLLNPPLVTTVGNPLSYTFPRDLYQDPDGDSVSYQTFYPGFLTYDSSSRTFYGLPAVLDRGIHPITIIAKDPYGGAANQTVLLDINGIPLRQFELNALQTSAVGLPYVFTLPAGLYVDPDGDAITYTLTENVQFIKPNWLRFNTTSQTLFGTPPSNNHQAIPIRFSVSDGRGGLTAFDLSLSTPNTAPIAVGLNDQTVAVGQVLSAAIPSSAFYDADADSLTYSLGFSSGVSQSWVTLAKDVITLVPKSGNQGTYHLNLMATDGYGGQAGFNFTVTVPNNPPSLMYTIPNPSAASAKNPWSALLDLDNFADVDNDPLRYTAKSRNGSLPSWINFNPSRRLFTGTPSGADRGIVTLLVIVDDGYGGQAEGVFNVTVINSAPQADGRFFDQQVSKLESSFSFTVPSFSDADGDSITYTAEMLDGSMLPSWLNFYPSLRTFSTSPVDAPAGNYLINVLATDSFGLSQKVGFNLAIITPPTIDLSTSKTELAKSVAPFAGAGALLSLIAAMLVWRQRRIQYTNLQIQQWSKNTQLKPVLGAEAIEFSALSTLLQTIADQLSRGIALSVIESNLLQFERKLRLYYAQTPKPQPMTTLLEMQIVEKLVRSLERHVLEVRIADYDNEATLVVAKLLHGFIRLILAEHTGRKHHLSQKTKELYVKNIDALIARVKRSTRTDIEILHQLESAREALICISDTSTLKLLCQASATHILSPGLLLEDLRKLAFDIPSTWYVKLLELNLMADKAKTDISVLTKLQSEASQITDWRFRYGIIPLLLDIIINTENSAIRTQAMVGRDGRISPVCLGFRHLLAASHNQLYCSRNRWIENQTKWALNQAQLSLSPEDRISLSAYLNSPAKPSSAKKIVLHKAPSGLSTELDTANSSKLVSAYAGASSDNPLYRTVSVLNENPLSQPRTQVAKKTTHASTSHPALVHPNPMLDEINAEASCADMA